MNFGLKIILVNFVIAVCAMSSTYAQSSMPYSYLPPGSTPGVSLILDHSIAPELVLDATENSTSSANSSKMKLKSRLFSSKDFELEYSLIMLGVDQESAYESFQILSFRIYSTMKYRIADSLFLFVEPYLIFRTGSDQSSNGNSHSGTIFFPKDASLIWTPIRWWQLRGGILDQNFTHSMLMLEDQAFLSLRTSFYLGTKDLGGSLVAEESILTYTANTNTTNQLEKTPTLTSVAIESHFNLSRRSQIKLAAGYWQYDNLPSSLAALAMLGGNTVNRTSDTFSVFAYQYKGIEARSRLEMGWGPFDLNLYSEGLYNSAAPQGLNTAWSAGSEIAYRSTQNRKFGFNAEYFHVEPDAAISEYNSYEFDRSNRNGIMLMPYFKWGKKQNKLGLRFVQSQLIYNNAPQSEVTQFRLRWETDYDLL